MSIDEYLLLGDKLVSTGKYEEASFAIRFIVVQKKRLTGDSFNKFGNWLENGIINWAHTDMLCGELLSFLIASRAKEIESLTEWIHSSSVWKRRAVPVTLIDILKMDLPLQRILKVIEPLMEDKEQMVQKGLGWFLREAWKRYPEQIEIFLLKWKDRCGRIIIQYACEKMSREEKSKFKKNKNRI